MYMDNLLVKKLNVYLNIRPIILYVMCCYTSQKVFKEPKAITNPFVETFDTLFR